MIYYTIYMKNLHNDTGYIDVALADEQLLKDFMQYLDVGIKPTRTYVVTVPGGAQGRPVVAAGTFAINLAEVAAISIVKPDSSPVTLPPSETLTRH